MIEWLIILYGSLLTGAIIGVWLALRNVLAELRTIRTYLNNFHLDVWNQINKDRL